MARDLSLRTAFDEVAHLYDEARPGYPEALFEDAIALSGIPPGGRILEIGCGPGKATLPFARRGYAMLCLELGQRLAALAAEHCRPYPGVEVQNVAFEDWPLQAGAFALVFSAQAFHWIPPEIGYPKAAAALRGTGALVLVWTRHQAGNAAFTAAVEAVYQQIAPQLAPSTRQPSAETLETQTVADIQATGLFGDVAVRHYPWSEFYSAEDYVRFLRTFSSIQALPEGVRRDLLAGIGAAGEGLGGRVEMPSTTVMYVARVRRILQGDET